MMNHDVEPGKLEHCQITGSNNLNLIIDLGHQAPCDSLLTKEMLNKPEKTYPLRLFHCPESGLAQLDYVIDGGEIYYPDYPYRSGISKPLEVYQRAFADDIVKLFDVPENSLCMDIGSNDGTLLTGFKRNGMKCLGVEPTNIAEIARNENDIETIQSFFTEKLAKDIRKEYGSAKIITMTNVFAHMAPLGEVMRGLCELLDKDGVFITESHYLLDVMEKNQFDTIYHEHIRTYSLKSLVILFKYYGLEVFDVQRADRYGGNIRAYVCWEGTKPINKRVKELLDLENEKGLHEIESWVQFKNRIVENKNKFMEFLIKANINGQRVYGNSCPGRSSSLLNYYGVTEDLMPYIFELPTSLKLGMFLPGKHIPILNNRQLIDDQPDYLVILSWHYLEPIMKRLKSEGIKSKLVVPLPEFTIIDT